MKRLISVMLIAAAAAMTFVSCNPEEGKDDNKDVAVTAVKLDKTALAFTVGDAAQTLTATVEPADATDKTITWTSSDEKVATVAGGVVTPKAEGKAIITAACGDKTATCNVVVSAAPVPVTGIKLSDAEITIALGDTYGLEAFIEPADADNPVVEWESDNEAVATVDEGAVKSVGTGTCTITATSNDGGFKATCKVTVEAGMITLTDEMVYSSAPIQYVGYLKGADDDGMGGSPDWCSSYFDGDPGHYSGSCATFEEMMDNRRAHYGEPSNMWDEDPGTCFSTNKDFWITEQTWGAPSDRCVAYHCIDITFDTPVKNISLYLQNAQKYVYFYNDNGFNIYTSADGETFEKTADSPYFTEGGEADTNGANAEITIESIANEAGIRAIRFDANGKSKGGSDGEWTENGAAFGIAELKIWRLE